MSNVVTVYNKKQLKQALASKATIIVIKEAGLAKRVRNCKVVSKATIMAAITVAGIALGNIWNPIGSATIVTTTVVSGVIGSSIALDLVFLGLSASFIMFLYTGYNIKAKTKITLANGTIIEGDVILEKN